MFNLELRNLELRNLELRKSAWNLDVSPFLSS